MKEINVAPEYIFESSWEVCNKVGGIYTVLSTKARTLQEIYPDKVIFIGPDIWRDVKAPDFIEDKKIFAAWRKHAQKADGLEIKTGRWDIPGTPPVILVDFKPFLEKRNELYYIMWEHFGVNSMSAYGDYDDSCLFAYATGKVIESFYKFHKLEDKKVIALFNEWMLGMGALYVKKELPAVATIFTTHATSIGRSIAGNDKPLYSYMDSYNGDVMARELNMEAKHSLEKQAAKHVDCFTTVSDITAIECKQLLDKAPDIVTPNGFERDFVPEGDKYTSKREEARQTLINVAEKLLGTTIHPNALLISTSGRYEYRNKGIDVFIEAMDKLRTSEELTRDVIAFIMVPAWVQDVRADLKAAIELDVHTKTPMQMPFCTHWLNQMERDKVLNYIQQKGFTNNPDDKMKIIFVPCYLNGNDGIFNKPYYDLLIGMDATIYPSYYEPWGYTPLESVAFGVPTITTDLAGFGLWARKEKVGEKISQGVRVINRTDYNYFEVAEAIEQSILELCREKKAGLKTIRERCNKLALRAEWSKFITHYQQAFDIALKNAKNRM
ncbi:glycosyltransferase involved in cell wall biosynthesis [Parabacteroides sp. PF5-5]|uniref:glycosyltransferase n=1 Tax=unclassified Parabacteroides TaxID=2649774 RepID=UPI002474C202|nr:MULTISPECIES: glycosyltransferase [unclassified Parabacteroides]MDH6315056.1 glycosyltransferase involved in cell wall biosynthesis [Parabacteroides sp. PF5-13]MDH6326419.1 glycosyltransferase involved in cell wall biosynthesis [Parabacteroides sp. PH5-41]MDH6334219.1 glycosyltransferase involved in cell wall biosynthesis [Parabacteroides sp. PF5-5]MDH6345111.1 glycosyltransferase involved in cell wall biosynthesis [Parabacteroides sp. PH5-46]MDH6360240.1 glycosyltransferase involved in cel